ITVSDGVSWCRIASTQLPPLPPGSSDPPTEEDLNAAALALSGCIVRLGNISITRTPRGKHIILARAFQVISQNCQALAERLQTQRRPEVVFPSLPEGGHTAPPSSSPPSYPPPSYPSSAPHPSSHPPPSYPSSSAPHPSSHPPPSYPSSSAPHPSSHPPPSYPSSAPHPSSHPPPSYPSSSAPHPSSHHASSSYPPSSHPPRAFSRDESVRNAPFRQATGEPEAAAAVRGELRQFPGQEPRCTDTRQAPAVPPAGHQLYGQQSRGADDLQAPAGPQRHQSSGSHRSTPYPAAGQPQQGQHGLRPMGAESFIPLKDLTAYVAKWTIRARVDVKGDIRKYNGARGPGQLFNVELKDKDGEIRATFFNAAVDKWYNILQEGKVYYFRGGSVKPKNPRFNHTRHDYELTFDEKSSIVEAESGADIPSISRADLVDIRGIEEKEVNSTVSLIAIVHDYRPIQSITIKSTGQQKPKRDVFLVDEGGRSLVLTLWGEKTETLPEEQLCQKPLVLLKSVKVGDWNGRKLDSQGSTRVELFPDGNRAAEVQDWWNQEGSRRGSFASLSGGGLAVGRKEILKSLEQVAQEAAQAEAAVLSDKGVYATSCALLERIGDDRFSWPACPDCRKKMNEEMPRCWQCPSCRKQCEQPNHTYMLNLSLMDLTGSLRCSCIGEKAEEFMANTKAETVLLLAEHRALDEQGRSFQDIFADANLEEWIFRICSKYDSWMDEVSIKQRVVAAAPLFRRVGEQTQHRLDFVRTAFHHLNIPLP
ncbi:replication factor-a protein 1 (rpa1) subfamily protein, partial [Toxoplasma gondii FOU]